MLHAFSPKKRETCTWQNSVKGQEHSTMYLHCVSENVPPLQLAIIFTYTVRLLHFLAQMLHSEQWTVLGYLTISTNVKRYQTHQR